MVEQSALLDLYRTKVQELKFELKDKDKVIQEIKLTMEQNNVNRAVPDIALKIEVKTKTLWYWLLYSKI